MSQLAYIGSALLMLLLGNSAEGKRSVVLA